MCNICNYPDKANHLNWAECASAWRERAGRMETAAIQERAEKERLQGRSAAALLALDDLCTALASHLYATADYDADRARRALDGRL